MLHDTNKLKSKEAYLAGGGHMVLGASWGPGESAGSDGGVSGTRGSRGKGKIFTNPEIKHNLN